MKFTATAFLVLLPFTVLAAPAPTPGDAPVPGSAADELEVSDADLAARDVFTRASNQYCKIRNVNEWANCRTGPGTNYPLHTYYKARKGVKYLFDCKKRGTCHKGNCTWDKLIWNGGHCYVNGYFTDDNCTIAKLGWC